MVKKQVFYSFHSNNDSWRTRQVWNIGVVGDNVPVSSNDGEEVQYIGEDPIKRWINTNMEYRSYVIVINLGHICYLPYMFSNETKTFHII